MDLPPTGRAKHAAERQRGKACEPNVGAVKAHSPALFDTRHPSVPAGLFRPTSQGISHGILSGTLRGVPIGFRPAAPPYSSPRARLSGSRSMRPLSEVDLHIPKTPIHCPVQCQFVSARLRRHPCQRSIAASDIFGFPDHLLILLPGLWPRHPGHGRPKPVQQILR